MMNKIRALAMGLSVLSGLLCFPNEARGAFIFNVTQVGSDVMVTGSGTLNTADLTYEFTDLGFSSSLSGEDGVVSAGDGMTNLVDLFSGVVGPSIGPGIAFFSAEAVTGDFVFVNGSQGFLAVPNEYAGGFLTNSATFLDSSFFSLGISPGTYVYTWGAGANADSVTVNIEAVPEPATVGLLALGGCAVLYRLRKRR